MKSVEFRDRSARAPKGLRIFLGRPTNRAQAREMEAQRDLLKRLARRHEYDILQAIQKGTITVEHVCRLVDEFGIGDYRAHLDLRATIGAPTLDEHVERWLGTVEKAGTRRTYRLALVQLRDFLHADARLGDRPWHAIGLHHVQAAQGGLKARLARATVQTYTAAWSAFFDWARLLERGEAGEAGRSPLMEANPVREAKAWITVHPTRQRFLSHDEFAELLRVAPPPMRAQYATLTLCGLRGGELRNLPPTHVHDTHVHIGPWGSWVPKGYPRSDRGVRDVPVHPTRLLPLLQEYREEWAGEHVFFVNPRTGEPWSGGAFRGQFYNDARAAGLKTGADGQSVSPHTCRHTFASWLAQDDVQLLKIARLMGDTVDTVTRYYAHILPSDMDKTVLRLFPDGNGGGVQLIDPRPKNKS